MKKCDGNLDNRETLEQMADELIAKRTRKYSKRQRHMHYAGLRRNKQTRKYAECDHTTRYGSVVRLLDCGEIEEFRAHIQRILDPSLRMLPATRKNVV